LKNTFNNVIDIKLVSSEFPYSDLLIKNNINDKIYWKNIEDGNHIYSIQIDEGFYTSSQLVNKIQYLMNNTPRITSSNLNIINNNFIIKIEENNNNINFYTYKISKLYNCLSIRKINILNNNSKSNLDNNMYYILNVSHPDNIVNVNDVITINNSTDITFKVITSTNSNSQNYSVSSNYINKSLTVYAINKENNSYDIILGNVTEITVTLVNYESAGGENIQITSNSKSSFLFNYNDTAGKELGFTHVGDPFSITDFKFIISNSDSYINNVNLDSVGNVITYNHRYFNFAGNYNYFLMYLNNIEFILVNCFKFKLFLQ
jgi:hypothetical protein